MKELKQKLITYLCKTWKGKVKPAKKCNGLYVFADISLERANVEQFASACDLSGVVSPERTNQFTGEVQPARAWIGAVDDNTSEEDLLKQI